MHFFTLRAVVLLCTGLSQVCLAGDFSLLREPRRASGWLLAEAFTYITTKDGKTHVGQVLQQLERGYLFKLRDGSTLVIDYSQVDDIQGAAVAAPPPARTPHAPPAPAVEPHRPAGPLVPQSNEPRADLTIDRSMALRSERAELIGKEPSLVFPIISAALGAIMLPIGFAMIPIALGPDAQIYGRGAPEEQIEFVLAAISALLITAGVTFLVVGIVTLVKAIVTRVKLTRRVIEIDRELEQGGERPPETRRELFRSGLAFTF